MAQHLLIRRLDAKTFTTDFQALHMPLPQARMAIHHGYSFKQSIAILQATIESRDAPGDFTIDQDG